LEKQSSEKDFWKDSEKAGEVMKKLDNFQDELKIWQEMESELENIKTGLEMLETEKDKELQKELTARLKKIEKDFKKYELKTFLSGKYDRSGAILAIHSGAGGVDAQDWTEMLLKMYLKYSENKNYQAKIIDQSFGGEAGIKNVVLNIKGDYAYGFLKSEAGVHRLVRISPFDAEHLRHTSFALVEVLPEIREDDKIKINSDDLKIDTFRSSGPGGQSVNTTDSAIRITHLPTGIVAACQTERSQMQNRENAMKLLRAKIFQKIEEEKEKEKKKIRGEYTSAEWGSQIRSYVLHPYKLAKDHRTGKETNEVEKVLEGEIDGFIESYLKNIKS
jgi:peptide chain release factor 2